MFFNKVYSKATRRVKKAMLKFLEYSYQNDKLDAIEEKLIVLGCKELVGAYGGGFIPDKAYEMLAKEITKTLDKVNIRLQGRLKNDEQK